MPTCAAKPCRTAVPQATHLPCARQWHCMRRRLHSTPPLRWPGLALRNCSRPSQQRTHRVPGQPNRRVVQRNAFRHWRPIPQKAHTANAIYYQLVARDATRAAAAAEAALKIAPNDAALLTVLAPIEITLGRWESALAHLRYAAELDPRSPSTARWLGSVLRNMRRLDEAATVLDHGLALAPAELIIRSERVMVELARGDLAAAQQIVRRAPSTVDPAALVAFVGTFSDLFWVLDDAHQKLLLSLSPSAFGDSRQDWAIVMAQTHWVRGDTMRARAYADSARVAFNAHLQDLPDDPQPLLFRGLAHAYLGRKAEALRDGQRGVELLPGSKDAYY